jgi:hypothetical protein
MRSPGNGVMRFFRVRSGISCLLIAAGVCLVAGSCAQNSRQVARQFKRYAEASASHDLRALEMLTAEDISWQLGRYRLVGREDALAPNAYDLGMENELEYRNVQVDGNVVECEVIERNETIEAIGMTEVHQYPRYTFENGLVLRKEPSGKKPLAEYSMTEFHRRMSPLRKWIRETHPEVMSRLVDPDKGFIFSQENGALMLRLTREWVAAGSPGRLPPE